ncbi:Peptidoglycan deacetylase [Baekduia alba]|uniref:polysaccharide deacetylase family protein n=1 Tax=Baekduia alba TaxID=2997333 RepID=UPI00233FB7EE|nr:polysaccharide deacetylase [Baekduia alba]WCB92131.1 Peptidoglycan deacetylase [Baekduia alba]
MTRHLVCLTFDFDTSAGMIARGLTSPTPVSRGEFGAVAAPRILRLLERRGLASTWFVPGYTAATYPDAVRAVAAAGHEIGNHGWSHVPPAQLAPADEERELVEASALLEDLSGRAPRGYRSPSWDLSPVTIELLERHGFAYDSSMMGNDFTPYPARVGDRVALGEPLRPGRASAVAELPVSWALDDFPHLEYLKTPDGVQLPTFSPSTLFDNALGDFTWMQRELDRGVLTITMHPYIIGRGHRLLALEAFVDALVGRGARFVTAEAAVAAWQNR